MKSVANTNKHKTFAMRNVFLSLLLLVSGFATAHNIVGSWHGKASFGAMSLRLIFNIEFDGITYKATMQSPDQTNVLIPVESVSLEDSVLILNVPTIKFTYEGVVKSDSEIDGFVTQLGQRFDLNLSREAIVLNRPQEPKPPYPYRSEDVTFKNAKAHITLAGTLTLPSSQADTKYPAVVLVTGSGAQNRDEEMLGHKPFAVIADYLTRHGIAVLRYDDRGVAQSEGNFGAATTFDFADDAEAAVAFLKSQEEIDSDRIGIIGHSEGGIIAFVLGARLDDLSYIVSLAGSGVKGDSLLLKQAEDVFRSLNTSPSLYEPLLEKGKQIYTIIEEDDNVEVIKENVRVFLASKGENDENIEKQVSVYTAPWIMTFIKYDPQENLQKVKCPVLAVNGDRDIQVDADMNLNAIKDNIEVNGNKNVTIKKYAGLNHLFQKCKTCTTNEYGELEETFNVEVLSDIKDWILALE